MFFLLQCRVAEVRERSERKIEMHGTIARAGRRASTAGHMAVLCMVLAGASFGCVPSRRSPFVDPDEARIRIQVINRAFQDATLHAIWSGGRRRLGIVIGNTTANYVLPWERSVLLRFGIDLLAGSECTTREVWANPGDILVLEIQSGLRYCGL